MDDIYYEPLLSLTIGLILIFIVRGRGERKRKILSNCKEAEGLVVDQEKSYSGAGRVGSTIYYPIIRFVTGDEVLIKEQYPDGRYPIKYKTGEQITVQYFVDDPKEFLIKGDNPWLVNAGVVLAGVGLILYSGFLLLKIFVF